MKLISCWPRLHSPLLLSTGTRAAVIPLRIARIERLVPRRLHQVIIDAVIAGRLQVAVAGSAKAE